MSRINTNNLRHLDATVDNISLDSNGRVGIGTTAPATQFAVQNASTTLGIEVDTTSGFASGPTLRGYYRAGSAYTTLALTGSQVAFGINDVEKARLDASGRLLVGTSTARSTANTSSNAQVQIEAAGTYAAQSICTNSANATAPYLSFVKSRGSTSGSTTLVSQNDYLGYVSFDGADGSTLRTAAAIYVQVDGNPGAGDMPGRLVFSTTADGA